jgi:hypothetical protein
MLPLELGKQFIKKNTITLLSEPVQKYYNGPCFAVNVENNKELDEINKILKKAYQSL